ncbi:MAG TPA: NAD(+)/NADH kinase [Urbifossiella sp.]|jgi:NAD kinase/nicotinic acid mononucleotide adenylyltransferase|nr:NAD(+)/NADH kinase [Urbifossiella sp.]
MTDLAAAARRAAADPDDPAAVGAVLAAAQALCAARGWDAAALAAAAVPPAPTVALAAPDRPAARRVALYTGYFDPPTCFHREIVDRLRAAGFDAVVIRPDCPRRDYPDAEHAAGIHRAVMTDLAFDAPGVSIDLTDLDDQQFTPHAALERRYSTWGEVWHVVSDEFVAGGAGGESIVQTRWEDGPAVWAKGRFVVFHPPGSPPAPADLPPTHRLLPADGHLPTADVRAMVFNGGADAAEGFVPPPVAEYIRRHGLFTSALPPRGVRITLDRPRLKIVCGPQKEARDRAAPFRHLEHPDPNLILVLGGDGTMLHAIRQHWRLRLPFLGLNAGHLGHLMNEIISADLTGAAFVLYRMPMLRVDTVGEDGVARRALGFNDAWVERDSGQGAWLRVEVNGEVRLGKVVADGLLVAAPSGSSAYARAMGATPVPLNSPVITLAGSNVFTPRFWKPLALPDDTVVKMTSVGDPAKRPVRGFLDGLPLGRVKSMEVRVSPVAAVELAFTPAFDLSARLLRSLFPPDDSY